MILRNVSVKGAKWTPERATRKTTTPATLTLTLAIVEPDGDDLKRLIDFAQSGICNWNISELQRLLDREPEKAMEGRAA